jgi:hypothetical protein
MHLDWANFDPRGSAIFEFGIPLGDGNGLAKISGPNVVISNLRSKEMQKQMLAAVFVSAGWLFSCGGGADGEVDSAQDSSAQDPGANDDSSSSWAPNTQTGTSAPKVCVYKRDGRMACPGYNSHDDETWECENISVLPDCVAATKGFTDCFDGCCSDFWTWGHQLVSGTCAEALAAIENAPPATDDGSTCLAFNTACGHGAAGYCCDGLVCVDWGNGTTSCGYSCDSGADCQGNCCAALQEGGGVCANPRLYCGQ